MNSIDKNTIVSQLYCTTGKPTNNFLLAPPNYVSDTPLMEYNMEKAKELLDNAG
ncbi:hypothetical protein [Geminocystis herdmanii]|uniref:hypothetical protein n=1 Tax=Geminocystis herdmanii TaxID=669359 RepID=UPI00034BECFD|nr:hypothetical protein [Geminocystis herdmanii]